MQTTEFEVGSRVVAVEEYDGNASIVGVVGTIRAYDGEGRYSVEYDAVIDGHDLEGKCEYGHGWHTSGKCLELYKEPEPLAPPMAYDEVMI